MKRRFLRNSLTNDHSSKISTSIVSSCLIDFTLNLRSPTTIGVSPYLVSTSLSNVGGYFMLLPRTKTAIIYDRTLKVNSGPSFTWERIKLESSLEREITPKNRRRVNQYLIMNW